MEEAWDVITKLKTWLYKRFLPAWCRDDLTEANERLREKLAVQRREIERLSAYIDGMEYAMRRRPRIIINAKEVREE